MSEPLTERFEHVGMDEAAKLLAISRRTLSTLLSEYPDYCAFAGRAKVFYREHLATTMMSTSSARIIGQPG